VLRSVPHLPVHVVSDFTVPAGTKTILALGGDSLKQLQTEKVIAKNRTITAYRTLPQMRGGVPVLISYDSSIGEIDYGYHVDLLTDVTLAIRFCLTGNWKPAYGKYRYVPDFAELCTSIEQQHKATGKPVDVAKDLETLGLDPYALPSLNPLYPGAYIVTMQATHQAGTADVVRFSNREHETERLQDQTLREQIEFLLRCPYVRLKGANFKYDLHWLWKRGGFTCSTFCFDTTIVGSLLDENRSNSLDTHTKIYVPSLGGYADVFNATVDKSRMDQVPPDQLLPYAGGDVDADLQVAAAQKTELLRDKQLTSFYVNILHPAARAFEWVEQGGVLVDLPAFQELKADLEQEHQRLVKEACKIMGGRIVAKHGYMVDPGGFNLTKASMLCDFMFSPMGLNLKPQMYTAKPDKDGIKRPSTAMEHLEMFAEVPEAKAFVEIIREDSGVMKTYNTYVVGFLEHLRSDGRFHPTYYLFVGNRDDGEGGAKTGRLSCKAPAFQCCVGETEVVTNQGSRCIDWLVEQRGAGLHVLSHTGQWQPIVDVHRNGVQPVFRVSTVSGRAIDCTANHPLLTPVGWVRTDQLVVGDRCYVTRTPHATLHESDVLLVERDEESLLVEDIERLVQVWGAWDQSVPSVDDLRRLLEQHGREAGEGMVYRAERRKRELRTGQLLLGDIEGAGQQSSEYQMDYIREQDADRGAVGAGVRDFQRPVALPALDWPSDGASTDEDYPPDRSVFQEDCIVSIEPVGERETFDLTIEGSHSFIANGIAVHNTVPKHTKYAQRIRRCYPAPPGYVVVERDYGQGELRVIACVAHETGMLAVFKAGRDIHADTAAPFSGFTYEKLMALEATDPHTFEETRQLGKAGNFGLCFGMKEDGFVIYARVNYGVNLSWDEAHDFRNGFFKKYPQLLVYHEWAKSYARQHKFIRTPLGRLRHLPLIKSPNREVAAKAERQAINSPIQGCLTDMGLWTIALEQQSGLAEIAPCFGACHDSLMNYVPEDRVDEIVTRQLDQMESLPFEKVGWQPQLTFVADARVGKNWGDMTKFKRKK